jgi:hypothetical protein
MAREPGISTRIYDIIVIRVNLNPEVINEFSKLTALGKRALS